MDGWESNPPRAPQQRPQMVLKIAGGTVEGSALTSTPDWPVSMRLAGFLAIVHGRLPGWLSSWLSDGVCERLGQSMLPAATTHSHFWPVTAAMRSKSES